MFVFIYFSFSFCQIWLEYFDAHYSINTNLGLLYLPPELICYHYEMSIFISNISSYLIVNLIIFLYLFIWTFLSLNSCPPHYHLRLLHLVLCHCASPLSAYFIFFSSSSMLNFTYSFSIILSISLQLTFHDISCIIISHETSIYIFNPVWHIMSFDWCM